MTRFLSLVKSAILVIAMSGCAGPQVVTVLPANPSADAPYDEILVVSLFEKFDHRRYLEEAIVEQLTARGVNAVASTSRMNTRTPLTRETFVGMVQELGSDALLLTQPVELEIDSEVKEMRPESTYNVWPTWYYNVFAVELTEYREPRSVEFDNTLKISVQLYSVSMREPVWAIETTTRVKQDFDDPVGAQPIVDEATAIARHLARDGMLAR